MTDPGALYDDIREEVGRVLIGNEHVVEGLTVALLSDGHVLLEGVPGIAKTTTAELFARATGLESARIQMTPDVLPADVTGTKVYREETGTFETRKGPIFANVVVADEINRATPKTQSALLEAMAERNVTIEGEGHPLPAPFLVVATQNPIEMEGTFVLAEAQRDRFQQKLRMDLPERDDERLILNRFDGAPSLGPESVEQVATAEALLAAREAVTEVHVAPEVKEYALDLVDRTREHNQVEHGASPRASLAFLHAGKARAAIHGRDYVIPDDIKALARPVLIHRLVLNTDAEIGGVDAGAVLEEILASVEPPAGETATGTAPDADGGGAGEDDDTGTTDDDGDAGTSDGDGDAEAGEDDAGSPDEEAWFDEDADAATDGTGTAEAESDPASDAAPETDPASEDVPAGSADDTAEGTGGNGPPAAGEATDETGTEADSPDEETAPADDESQEEDGRSWTPW